MTNTTVNTAANVETVEEMVIVPVREAVAVEIHALLDTIGTAYLKVGSLLNEARGDFEAQKEFLAWAEAEFSIKKAQCYNLMNVARTFDGDERFTGVAMRVMLALVAHADDADIMTKAAELAHDGKLDTAAVNALTGKPVKVPAANPVVAGIEQAKAAEAGAQPAESQPLQTVPAETQAAEESAPFDTETAPSQPAAPRADNEVNAANAREQALLDTIKQLNAQIADMQATLNARTSERETRKAAAPMLPQFKSKCMYARLGLSAEQSKTASAIKKAKRDLVKLGYGEGHDAYPLIEEAASELLNDAQAIAQ